jgi:hypothetical protein
MINRFIFAISVISLSRPDLNPTGPVHESYAVNCLQELATKQFKYIDVQGLQSTIDVDVQLLTIMTTANMTSPAYEIQRNLIKRLNTLLRFNIEVIDDDRREFGVELVTSFYLLVVDCVAAFERKLEVLTQLNSYNSNALFLVYYSNLEKEPKSAASLILEELWEKSINNAIVLVPVSLREFDLYSMRFDLKPSHHCLDSAGVRNLDRCIDGVMKTSKKYYEIKAGKSFKNCTLDVVANKIDPFVISESDGFEISLIKQIGETLNVFFNVTLTGEDSWGMKDEEGRWTDGLGRVYDDDCLGVGNFYVVPEYGKDFSFTNPHFVSDLVWVVPVAQYVPKWRVLTVIFSWYLWILCLVLILTCAVLLKFTSSLSTKESRSYKRFGDDLLVAFQVIITVVAAKPPRSDWTRVVFVALAAFSIVISSVYTSSLINFLTRPQREHQVDSIEGALNQGWDIGGLPVYESIFNVTEDERSMRIFDIFQSNTSLHVWMTSVADDRDTCTISSDFFINYMLAQQDEVLTDENGKPKIYILEDKIFSYSVVIVTKSGFPFLDRINHVIGLMSTFGLVKAMALKYTRALDKINAMRDDDNFVQPLSLDHLQGAFAILFMGYSFGFLFFLIEAAIVLIKTKLVPAFVKLKRKKIKPLKA